MKNALQISLVIILMLSISGVVVSKHYCGPFLKKIEIGHISSHCTDMDEAEMPADCCKNTTEFQSLDADFLKIDKLQQESPTLHVLYALQLPSLVFVGHHDAINRHNANDAGPPLPAVPLFLENRTLII